MGKNKFIFLVTFLLFIFPTKLQTVSAEGVSINFDEGMNITSSVDVFLFVTMLSLLPPLIISMTVYVQIIIVLSLTRQAMGVAMAPPNMVLTGLALILTLFIMYPVIDAVNTEAYEPYKNEEITFSEAIEKAEVPIKRFMVNNSKESYIKMYAKIAGKEDQISTKEDVPFLVASAANITTQISKALAIGAVLMMCFIVIDIIVGSILMLLGMFMLPPQMISLPIKIITFLAAGGYSLIIEIMLQGINI